MTDDAPARLTVRQQLVDLLEQGPISLRELASLLALRMKEASRELDHVSRSVAPRRIQIDPAICGGCGYVFRKRTRWTRPGKCPLCRSKRISEPLLSLR